MKLKKHFLPTLVTLAFLMAVGLSACKDDLPEPEKPSGDPAQAAQDFIAALFSGNASAVRELTSDQTRLSFLETATAYANAHAEIDLSQTKFEVIAEQAVDRRTIRMSGVWVITADTPNGERATQVHDANQEGAVLLGLWFKDGKWRIDGMKPEEIINLPTLTPTS
ncbi:MAG: hypothetical protein HY862_20900 [Chloroflexi bacterium]|nr:hypothetical protein [Chloroflexota bacterium]